MTEQHAGEGRGATSIRRLLAWLLAALAILVTGLLVATSLQLRRADEQARVENRRTESFLIADSMRQSSNDLTRMVRLYVSTGRSAYREYYNEILAIRRGTAPRPRDYGSSFWDRVLVEGKGFVVYGRPQSLVDQMRSAHFADAEFAALNRSLRLSDDLAKVELEVMDRVQPRIDQGVNRTYLADVASDFGRLVDDAYLAEKGAIMRAVDRFVDLVDQRTLVDVEHVRDQSRQLFVVQLIILAAIVLVSVGAILVTRRLALRPLDALVASSGRIADGDYAERAQVHGVTELAAVAEAFNAMAASVEADVSARQHAETVANEARQVAEEATRAKSSFLASMSHEIRTPMIGVTGMLEVLAQTDLTRSQHQMVTTAQSSAVALLQIIGDTLDFSKIEAGKLEIATATFSLRSLIQAAADTFLYASSAKGLVLVAHCDERVAAAHVGDPLRIRQILSNFLSNSVKFTDVGGIQLEATVTAEAEGTQTVEVAVVDTGPGLSEEQQRRLFAEFAQAEPSMAQRYGGTGLGLVICRRLAVLMGGEVSMDSSPGNGTRMRLVLPLLIGDPADVVPELGFTTQRFAASRPTPRRDEAIAERSLLLLAEDHSVNRSVLLHQLDAIGFCADIAEDGQLALERFVRGDYAMVVTDLHMPRLTGYELAEAIRRHEADHRWNRTPIMALTANVMHGEPQRCQEAGMDDFASKPTTIPLLAAKLRHWLPHVVFPSRTEPLDESPPAPSTLDPTVLDELTGGDEEVASAVLADYMSSTRDDLGRLADALTAGAVEEVRLQAHRIKGASTVVGATTLTDLAEKIEIAAETGAVDGIADLIDDATGELTRVADAVAAG